MDPVSYTNILIILNILKAKHSFNPSCHKKQDSLVAKGCQEVTNYYIITPQFPYPDMLRFCTKGTLVIREGYKTKSNRKQIPQRLRASGSRSEELGWSLPFCRCPAYCQENPDGKEVIEIMLVIVKEKLVR